MWNCMCMYCSWTFDREYYIGVKRVDDVTAGKRQVSCCVLCFVKLSRIQQQSHSVHLCIPSTTYSYVLDLFAFLYYAALPPRGRTAHCISLYVRLYVSQSTPSVPCLYLTPARKDCWKLKIDEKAAKITCQVSVNFVVKRSKVKTARPYKAQFRNVP